MAFWDIKDRNNIYMSALSKNIYFNLAKNNLEYELFWHKQENLAVSERIENLYYLGYDYIIISDSSEHFELDKKLLESILGSSIKTTNHVKIYYLNNLNNISIETAKERFYELYNQQ